MRFMASLGLCLLCGCPPPGRACDEDAQCATTQVCVVVAGAGSCQAVSRTDAGPLDAGEFDAGEVDAGEVDAGEVDAGEVDAGEVDAGEVDAGEVDAGEVDAGEVDAGEVDAGEVDAGVPEGLALRGDLQIAPGVLRAGGTVLRGRMVGAQSGSKVRGGAFVLEASFQGDPP